MTNEEKTAAVEAFLRGDLSEAESRQFLNLLQQDPALQAELRLHRELEDALGPSPLNTLRDHAADVLREQRPAPAKRSRLVYWLLAAMFSLGLMAIWLVRRPIARPGNDQLFARYFQPPGELNHAGQPRSGSGQMAGGDAAIDSLYRLKNYTSALVLLEEQGRSPGFQPSSSYYYQLGMLYLINRQPGPALRNLDRIDVGYAYEKQWYRALAFLLSGIADDRAKAELSEIAHSDSPFRKDAADLYRRME